MLILTQLLVAGVVTVICVCIQTVSNIGLLYWVLGALKRLGGKHWVVWSVVIIAQLICAFVCIHLLQIGVWTLTYLLLGCFASIDDAIYFSLSTFLTLEASGVALPKQWRLLGPLEALDGIIAFGLSIGFMYTVISRMLNDRTRRLQEAKGQVGE